MEFIHEERRRLLESVVDYSNEKPYTNIGDFSNEAIEYDQSYFSDSIQVGNEEDKMDADQKSEYTWAIGKAKKYFHRNY